MRQGEAPGHCLGARRGAVGSIASSTRYLSVARTAKMRHFKQLRVDKLKMVVCVCVCVRASTMQAVLQMSAGGPYSAPIRTSRALYCLV